VAKGKKREQRSEVDKILDRIQELYGRIPLVSQVLSRRPDMFIPYFELSKSTIYSTKHLDPKTMELAAVCASSAMASEHCLNVHIEQASNYGASKEEIFEALILGSMMAMTKSQSVASRKFLELQAIMDENDRKRDSA